MRRGVSVPVASPNNSGARFAAPPLPDEAYVSRPGCVFARAISSLTDFAGSEGCTTRMFAELTSTATGVRSRIGSYGRFLCEAGITAYEMLAVSSV